MFCSIYKWMISWALDSGKSLPGLVDRHIRHCESCREFARVSGALTARLVREVPGFLRERHDPLKEKIISALAEKPEPKLSYGRRFNFRLLPALAAAVVVVVLLIGIVFQVIPPAPSHTDGPAFNDLSEAVADKMPLQDLAGGVESPMETEMFSLEQSISSATEFLVSCLEIRIGQQ
jgi:predicted anti-sigma-YlaC factor YlaD